MTSRRNRHVPRRTSGTKTCSRCQRQKPVADFYARHHTPDGLMAECKACNDARPRPPNPPKTRGFKTCAGCKERKPVGEFAAAKTGKYGRHCYCRDCDAIRRKVTRYGISVDEYRQMVRHARNACECCRMVFMEQRHICLDHCPKTNRVRGLLCKPCNCLVEKGDKARLAIIMAGQIYLQSAAKKMTIPEGIPTKAKGRRNGSYAN